MEKIFNNMTNNLSENVNSQLLLFMQENMSQFQKISSDINSVNDNLTLLNKEVVSNMNIQLSDVKKEYIDSVKQLLYSHSLESNEKITTMLDRNTDTLVDKTNIILNDVLPKNNDKLSNTLIENLNTFKNTIKQDILSLSNSGSDEQSKIDFLNILEQKYNGLTNSIQQPIFSYIASSELRINNNIQYINDNYTSGSVTQAKLFGSLDEFLGKYKNVSNKGKFGEHNLSSVINKLYPTSDVTNTTGTKASGDFIMRRSDRNDIMFENKDYTHNIPKDEISKFIRDIDVLQMSGIFISQNSGIAFKNNYQIDIHKGNVIVYIQYCNYDPEKIRIAVDIIDNFKDKMNEMNSKDVDNIISKSVLDDINNELQTFITQRDNIIVTMKDFNKKMTSMLQMLKMPSLEKYLGTRYASIDAGYSSNSVYKCDICNIFVGGNTQSLSAHKRGCSKKTKTLVCDNITEFAET
jgi:hypothetical protein